MVSKGKPKRNNIVPLAGPPLSHYYFMHSNTDQQSMNQNQLKNVQGCRNEQGGACAVVHAEQ